MNLFNPDGVANGPDVSLLKSHRTTHLIFEDGSTDTHTDDWRLAPARTSVSKGRSWTGMTIFYPEGVREISVSEPPPAPAPSSETTLEELIALSKPYRGSVPPPNPVDKPDAVRVTDDEGYWCRLDSSGRRRRVNALGDFWFRPKPMSKVIPISTRPLSIPVPTWKALDSIERRRVWKGIEKLRREDVARTAAEAKAEALPPEEEDKSAKIPVASREDVTSKDASPAYAAPGEPTDVSPTQYEVPDGLPGIPGLLRKFDPSYSKSFDKAVLREDDPDSTDTGGSDLEYVDSTAEESDGPDDPPVQAAAVTAADPRK